MSKLTLPILCAYLPHGVQVQGKYNNHITLRYRHFTNDYGDFIGIDEKAKLLLRPLSSLTDEQIAELDSLHDFSVMNMTQIKIAQMRYPYPIVQKLIEWHFDVFGLLESGNALPLNDHE